MPHLSLSLLGVFEATLDGRPITTFESAKVRALLAYLAVEAGRAHPRAALTELLWPEVPGATARSYLRHVLSMLREAIGDRSAVPPLLLITRETIQFNPAGDHELDVATFTTLLDACETHGHRRPATCTACAQRRARAVALYRGDFLASFFLSDSAAFEAWVALKRERLRNQFLVATTQLASYYVRRGDDATTQQYLTRQVEMDPWDEAARRQLMTILWRTGQRSVALTQYVQGRQVLERELGVEPEAATTALFTHIRDSGECPPQDDRGTRGRDALPAPTTPFIGREAELAQLTDLLQQPAYRLVTLTGPGGIGKTRLALQVADALHDDFADGVFFVALAPLNDPSFVIPAVAQALGVQQSSALPLLESLKIHLRTRQLLLVLDTFEHVSVAAPGIAELLGAASQLTVLVTSRASLHLSGEQEFPVPPLSAPDPKQLPSQDALVRYDAVALFLQRAQAVTPAFTLTKANTPAVAGICARLDGLPLAIELAAARSTVLSPPALLARLADPLALLTCGARDLPQRQQSLRSTIDWSYTLLSATEQRLFERLAVFVNGCTWEAIEHVCNLECISSAELLNDLQSLVDGNLVQSIGVPDSDVRFALLELLHDYAFERFVRRTDAGAIYERHAMYFVHLVEAAEPAIRGPSDPGWVQRLRRDYHNLHAAIIRSLRPNSSAQDRERGLRIAGSLGWWGAYGSLREERVWLEQALKRSALLPARVRAKALSRAGKLAVAQDEYAVAVACFTESLALSHEFGDRAAIASHLQNLGMTVTHQGNYGDAKRFYLASQDVYREIGDTCGIAWSLNGLGLVAVMEDDFTHATALYGKSLLLFRRQNYTRGVAWSLYNLANIARYQGDLEQASGLYNEGLHLWRAEGRTRNIAHSLNGLGHIALARSAYAEACAHFRDGIVMYLKDGEPIDVTACIAGLAAIESRTGHPQRAMWLFAAVASLRQTHGTVLPPAEQTTFSQYVAETTAQLNHERATAAWADGQAWTLKQAISVALEQAATPS